jgi:hypothetical protein
MTKGRERMLVVGLVVGRKSPTTTTPLLLLLALDPSCLESRDPMNRPGVHYRRSCKSRSFSPPSTLLPAHADLASWFAQGFRCSFSYLALLRDPLSSR